MDKQVFTRFEFKMRSGQKVSYIAHTPQLSSTIVNGGSVQYNIIGISMVSFTMLTTLLFYYNLAHDKMFQLV